MSLSSLKLNVGAWMNKFTSESKLENFDEDVIKMLTIQIIIAFAAELGNHIHEICQIALWIRTQYHLIYVGWGSDLDCNVIMQPNPGWGIIVNFKTILCIVLAEASICLCFAKGALLDRRTTLDNLVGGMKSGNSKIRIPNISTGQKTKSVRFINWSL